MRLKWIVVMLFIAAHGTAFAANPAVNSKKELEVKFNQFFQTVDSDKSGKISKAEAQAKDSGLAEHFDQMDANHDGMLTQKEIKNALSAAANRQQKFVQALEKADTDKNSKLSRDEAKALPNLSANFDQIDANKDDVLVTEEIFDFLRKIGDAKQ